MLDITFRLLPGAAEAGGAGCEEAGEGRVLEGGEIVGGAVGRGQAGPSSHTVGASRD